MSGFILLRTGRWVNVGQIVTAKDDENGMLLMLSDGTKEIVKDTSDREALQRFLKKNRLS